MAGMRAVRRGYQVAVKELRSPAALVRESQVSGQQRGVSIDEFVPLVPDAAAWLATLGTFPGSEDVAWRCM